MHVDVVGVGNGKYSTVVVLYLTDFMSDQIFCHQRSG